MCNHLFYRNNKLENQSRHKIIISYKEEDEEDLIDHAVEIKEKCAEDSCTKYKSRLESIYRQDKTIP